MASKFRGAVAALAVVAGSLALGTGTASADAMAPSHDNRTVVAFVNVNDRAGCASFVIDANDQLSRGQLTRAVSIAHQGNIRGCDIQRVFD